MVTFFISVSIISIFSGWLYVSNMGGYSLVAIKYDEHDEPWICVVPSCQTPSQGAHIRGPNSSLAPTSAMGNHCNTTNTQHALHYSPWPIWDTLPTNLSWWTWKIPVIPRIGLLVTQNTSNPSRIGGKEGKTMQKAETTHPEKGTNQQQIKQWKTENDAQRDTNAGSCLPKALSQASTWTCTLSKLASRNLAELHRDIARKPKSCVHQQVCKLITSDSAVLTFGKLPFFMITLSHAWGIISLKSKAWFQWILWFNHSITKATSLQWKCNFKLETVSEIIKRGRKIAVQKMAMRMSRPSDLKSPGAASAKDHDGQVADIQMIPKAKVLAKVIHHKLCTAVWKRNEGGLPPTRSCSIAWQALEGQVTRASGICVCSYALQAIGSLSNDQSWRTLKPYLNKAHTAWVLPENLPENNSPSDKRKSLGTSNSPLRQITAESPWFKSNFNPSTLAPSKMQVSLWAKTVSHCWLVTTTRTSTTRFSGEHWHPTRFKSKKTCFMWYPYRWGWNPQATHLHYSSTHPWT